MSQVRVCRFTLQHNGGTEGHYLGTLLLKCFLPSDLSPIRLFLFLRCFFVFHYYGRHLTYTNLTSTL